MKRLSEMMVEAAGVNKTFPKAVRLLRPLPIPQNFK
jgi:hypothetical protein